MRPFALLLLAALAAAGPAEDLAALLEGRRIDIHLEKASLETFATFLRNAGGFNVVLRRNVIEKQTPLEAIEITLRLENARILDVLHLALDPLDLAFRIERNILHITTRKDVLGKPVLVIYDVADLLLPLQDFPAPDMNVYPSSYVPPEPPEPESTRAVESVEELAELVRRFTGEGTWEDDGIRILPGRNRLFIRQYAAVHREIARFLAALSSLR